MNGYIGGVYDFSFHVNNGENIFFPICVEKNVPSLEKGGKSPSNRKGTSYKKSLCVLHLFCHMVETCIHVNYLKRGVLNDFGSDNYF